MKTQKLVENRARAHKKPELTVEREKNVKKK